MWANIRAKLFDMKSLVHREAGFPGGGPTNRRTERYHKDITTYRLNGPRDQFCENYRYLDQSEIHFSYHCRQMFTMSNQCKSKKKHSLSIHIQYHLSSFCIVSWRVSWPRINLYLAKILYSSWVEQFIQNISKNWMFQIILKVSYL